MGILVVLKMARFLMSEASLYQEKYSNALPSAGSCILAEPRSWSAGLLQGYLAHKKQPPPRTL